jgi:hypothetical protein
MTDATEALDAAILRAERCLRLLEELAEIGMDLARALHREAPAEPAKHAASLVDSADGFARLSRAIRMILTLHARTDEALQALRAGLETEREIHRAEAGAGVIRSVAASHRLQ